MDKRNFTKQYKDNFMNGLLQYKTVFMHAGQG